MKRTLASFVTGVALAAIALTGCASKGTASGAKAPTTSATEGSKVEGKVAAELVRLPAELPTEAAWTKATPGEALIPRADLFGNPRIRGRQGEP
ncbi:MAG: hypothetical protein IPL79_10280 [Myxococcales bacterium]|nr:hypothetical protein [Myxococcales bacterium]